MGKVVQLRECAPEWELARLNRETGLTFARLPVSLLPAIQPSQTLPSQAQEVVAVMPSDTSSLLVVRR